MNRPINTGIILKVLSNLRYLPAIILNVRNWKEFLVSYIALSDKGNEYVFKKGGIKLRTREIFDTATIAVVFFKKDYGVISDNSIVVDIGANIGAFSVYAATAAKNVAVFAYEPMTGSYEQLYQNISINNLDERVKVFKLGISAKAETRKMYLYGTSPFNSLYSSDEKQNFVEIKCISLEDIFLQNNIEEIDILKIDCEGAEFEIFYNAPDKCFKKIKEIRMEYHDQQEPGYNMTTLTKYLKDKGYENTYYREYINNTGNAWFKHKE